MCQVNWLPIFRGNFYRFDLKSSWNELEKEEVHLNVLNIVEENFLNVSNIGQLHDKALMLPSESTVNRNWVARVL